MLDGREVVETKNKIKKSVHSSRKKERFKSQSYS